MTDDVGKLVELRNRLAQHGIYEEKTKRGDLAGLTEKQIVDALDAFIDNSNAAADVEELVERLRDLSDDKGSQEFAPYLAKAADEAANMLERLAGANSRLPTLPTEDDIAPMIADLTGCQSIDAYNAAVAVLSLLKGEHHD